MTRRHYPSVDIAGHPFWPSCPLAIVWRHVFCALWFLLWPITAVLVTLLFASTVPPYTFRGVYWIVLRGRLFGGKS